MREWALRARPSALTKTAEQVAHQRLTPAVLNHSYRCYSYGVAIAALEDIDVDRELLFAAAMLHDTGLSEPVPRPEAVGSGTEDEEGWPESSCCTRYRLRPSAGQGVLLEQVGVGMSSFTEERLQLFFADDWPAIIPLSPGRPWPAHLPGDSARCE